MDKILIKILGTPKVYYKEVTIVFPFRKVEALFYYMVVNKQASRDELVNLLWSEIEDNNAKKNLRNAVYTLRKLFCKDVIISPQRANIILNNEIQWEIDLEQFSSCEDSSIVQIYKGEFLKGFLLKGADNFEQWMFRYREYYRQKCISKLKIVIEQSIQNQCIKQAEAYCNYLLQIDQTDEEACRQIMRIYLEQDLYNKGIEAYKKLKIVLSNELSIEPDISTKSIYNEIVESKSNKLHKERRTKDKFFFGREEELYILKQSYNNFINNVEPKSLIITGEAGVGKTSIIEKFLKNGQYSNAIVFYITCYQAEESYILKPWYDIFYKLSKYIERENVEIPNVWKNIANSTFPVFEDDLENKEFILYDKENSIKYQAVERTIINILNRVAERKKILLVVEDIQWIDIMSISLIKNLINQNQNKTIKLIVSCRKYKEDKLDKAVIDLKANDLLKQISIERLSKAETLAFIEKALPNNKMSNEFKELIYKETEGNMFFLVEVLNNYKYNKDKIEITSKMEDVLKSRIINISSMGQKILCVSSVFFDKIYYDDLKILAKIEEEKLIDTIEELQAKSLIKEEMIENKLYLAFTHQKLRDYIYGQMSISRRRLLHKNIAVMLEKKIKNNSSDKRLYSKLIYHYSKCGNKIAVLRYSIIHLEEYFKYNHEIFPIINSVNLVKSNEIVLCKEKALRQLQDLEPYLKEIEEENQNFTEYSNLRLSFFFMYGRFYISEGEYDKGIGYIDKVIDEAIHNEDYDFALKGLRQKIYYCINISDDYGMGKYIEQALGIARKHEKKEEVAIILRLKGIHCLHCGKYEEGEKYLQQSIKIFYTMNDRKKYALNIAAGYNFLGEIKRHKKQLHEALQYYYQAINICEDNQLVRGVTVIYKNAGQAAYALGDYNMATEYFSKALMIYSELDVLWGRAVANSYMAMVQIKKKNYNEIFKYLNDAELYAIQIKSPFELGVVYRAKAEACLLKQTCNKAKIIISDYIDKSLEFYVDTAKEFLSSINEEEELGEVMKLTQASE